MTIRRHKRWREVAVAARTEQGYSASVIAHELNVPVNAVHRDRAALRGYALDELRFRGRVMTMLRNSVIGWRQRPAPRYDSDGNLTASGIAHDRRQAVMSMAADGMTNREIANALGATPRQIKRDKLILARRRRVDLMAPVPDAAPENYDATPTRSMLNTGPIDWAKVERHARLL